MEQQIQQLQRHGKLREAGKLCREELQRSRAQTGDRSLETLKFASTLGVILQGQGKSDQAEPLCREVLDARRAILGDRHLDTLVAMSNLGGILQSQGKLEEAEPLCREALSARRAELGDMHPETLKSVNNVGMLLQSQGKLKESEKLCREALQARMGTLGPKHPDTLMSMNNLSMLLKGLKRLPEAEQLQREVLETRRSSLGRSHPDTLISVNNLGQLLKHQDKYTEAEPMYREVLDVRRSTLGDKHPETVNAVNNLKSLLKSQGKLEEAEPLFYEALDARRAALGDNHPKTLTSINNLGMLLKSQGKLEQAEPLYREALRSRRSILKPDHPDILASVSNMGMLLKSQGKLQEADPMYREALDIRRRTLGDTHADTLTSISTLGVLLQAMGKLDEAEPLCREALDARRATLGPKHPKTLVSVSSLASLFQSQGKLDQAEALYREALLLRREILGDRHPDTMVAMNNLDGLLQSRKQGQGSKHGQDPTALLLAEKHAELLRLQTELLSVPKKDRMTSPTKERLNSLDIEIAALQREKSRRFGESGAGGGAAADAVMRAMNPLGGAPRRAGKGGGVSNKSPVSTNLLTELRGKLEGNGKKGDSDASKSSMALQLPGKKTEEIAEEEAREPGDFSRWFNQEAPAAGGKGKGKGKGKKGKKGKVPVDAASVQRNAAIKAMYNDVFRKGGKRTTIPRGSKANAGAAFTGDLMSELREQSAFFKKVEAQAAELAPGLQALCPIIIKYHAPSETDLLDFVDELEKTLSTLEDEVQVLKICVPDWPAGKVQVLRELATRYRNLERLRELLDSQTKAKGWGNDVMAATDRIEVVFESVCKELDAYGRKKEDDKTRFASFGIDFVWEVLKSCKEQTVGLAKRYCQIALAQWHESEEGKESKDRRQAMLRRRANNLLQGAVGFGFKVYNYAGGFDDEATEIYGQVHACYQESQEATDSTANSSADGQQI